MQRGGRIAGVLLLVFVATTFSSALALGLVAARVDRLAGHPAGCHHFPPNHGLPASDNHQCCANGHESAIPADGFDLPYCLNSGGVIEWVAPPNSLNRPCDSGEFSGFLDPTPRSSPLRI